MRLRRLTLTVAVGAAVAGCGAPSTPGDDQQHTSPAVTSMTNDPELEAAANSVIPDLEDAFPKTYAGVELMHAQHTMVIYRLPDSALDQFVRTRITGITVTFRDARLSLAQMRELADQILRDKDYWRSKGITVNGVGPTPDGSSVEVFITRGGPDEERAFAERHGDGNVSVRAETPTLIAPTGEPYTPPR